MCLPSSGSLSGRLGTSLSQLNDVKLTLPVNNDTLTYNSATRKWENGSTIILNDGSILSTGTTDGYTIPSGSGTRMMWVPSKTAFRAGSVTSTQWDSGNIGNWSVAFGLNGTASGDYSTHFGIGNIADSYELMTLGQYSAATSGDLNDWVATDPILVVGTGTGTGARSTALTIFKNGNISTVGKGRFVGSDFMTDGGFDDDGAWSIGDNWSVTGSQGVYSGGAVAPTYLQPDPALTIISGRDYVASINIVSWSGTSPPTMWVGGDQNTLSTGTGVQYSYFTTVNTTNARLRAANQELTVDDFTLRLLPENPSEVGDLIVWRDLTVANTIDSGAITATAATIGDGTNETAISATGLQTMAGTARVLIDVDFEPDAVKKGGVGPGDSDEDGFSIHDYDPTNDESIKLHWEVPHDYASAGTVHIHFDWFVDTAPTTAKNVTWGVEYKKKSIGDNFGFTGTTTAIVNQAITTGTTANDKKTHVTAEISLITTGFEPGDFVLMRLFRDADASEDGATDDFGSDVRIFDYHLEYLSDKLGESI